MAKKTMSKEMIAMMNAFIFPKNNFNNTSTNNPGSNTLYNVNAGGSIDKRKNLANTFMPVPPIREKQDIASWRAAVVEMENPILPYRLKSQTIFRDTYLDPQVYACIQKRYNLTLLRKFAVRDAQGNDNEEWTKYFDKKWFRDIMQMILDARLFGYTLISIGDIKDDNLVNPIVVRRDMISPDRRLVATSPTNPTGESWDDEEYAPWHMWVPTMNEHGTSACGFGILYTVAAISIRLRNMLNDNVDFMQKFAAPYMALFTDVNDQEERDEREKMMQDTSSMGWGIFEKEEKLEFSNNSGGNGYKSYDSFEARMQRLITEVILGHADAINSTPGKIGGSQGGKESGAQLALYEIQQSDANFITPFINDELIPRLKWLGIHIPDGLTFEFLNSEEDFAIEQRTFANNRMLADTAQLFAKAGVHMDLDWLSEQTGIVFEKKDKTEDQEEINSEDVEGE